MKLFLDMEFTSLSNDAGMISIGLVSEDNRAFYAEFNDFRERLAIEPPDQQLWVNTNIKLRSVNPGKAGYLPDYHYGDQLSIQNMLLNWLSQFQSEQIELITDVGAYDYVHFVRLLTTIAPGQRTLCDKAGAMAMPNNFNRTYEDLNIFIAEYKGITPEQAFDIDRLELLETLYPETDVAVIRDGKHNALADALVIKAIFEKIY